MTKLASYIESRADRFAERRAVVRAEGYAVLRADLRADGFAEKFAPIQIHLQKCLQMPMQKQILPATKMPHGDYNCVKKIQIYSDKVQNGTDAESRAEHFADGGAELCAEAMQKRFQPQRGDLSIAAEAQIFPVAPAERPVKKRE